MIWNTDACSDQVYDNIIRGERLVLDLESGKSRIESPNAPGTTTGADGRVRALFLPQNAKEKPQ